MFTFTIEFYPGLTKISCRFEEISSSAGGTTSSFTRFREKAPVRLAIVADYICTGTTPHWPACLNCQNGDQMKANSSRKKQQVKQCQISLYDSKQIFKPMSFAKG
ncbi:hypothetical protein DPMN_000704 [Dreissena polymorpha]|uniref:Uncharacterized protein n=1 Tax=Dreissena polymorpha TaxID=45954 RepID=A0A9D4RS24_DREPO|nr:hypothetical protein DPMN_000704 [Dreissena polymorpha]